MRKRLNTIILILTIFLAGGALAYAAKDFNIKNNSQSFMYVNGTSGNVGIGTITPQGGLVVLSGNVGIGTFSPQEPFVQNNGQALFGTNTFVNGSGKQMQIYTNTLAQALEARNEANIPGGGIAVNGTTTGTSTSANIAFYGWATGAATNYGLYIQQGEAYFHDNVGIGTWNPSQALDVQGTVLTTGFAMSTGTPAFGYVLTAMDTNGNATWSPNTSVGAWTLTNTNDVYLPNNGNVGIGTTKTTTAALTVMNGNVGIGTWIPSSAFNVVNGDEVLTSNKDIGPEYFNFQRSRGSSGSLTIVQKGDSLGGFYFDAWTGSAYSVGGYIETSIDDNLAGTAPMAIIFGNRQPDSTLAEHMRISSAGNVGIGTTIPSGALTVMNGNVGIGTWVPGSALSIMNGNIAIGATTAPNKLEIDNAGALIGFKDSGRTPQAWTIGESDTAIGDFAIHDLTNSRIPFYVNTSDNVGIGSTNPGQLFDVQGTVRVLGSGNVGIGSSYPGQKLDVNGTIRSIGFAMTSGTPAFGYVLTALDSNGNATWSSNTSVGAWTVTNTNDVYLPNNGNVGIGTTKTTTAALTVMNGNVGIGTWVPAQTLSLGPDAAGKNIGLGSGGQVLFHTNGNGYSIYQGITSYESGIGSTDFLMLGSSGFNAGTGSIAGGLTIKSSTQGMFYDWPWESYNSYNQVEAGIGTSNTGVLDSTFGVYNWGAAAVNSGAAILFAVNTNSGSPAYTNIGKIGVIATDVGAATYKGDFVIQTAKTAALTEKLRVTSAGNVGIGSTAPGQLLDVQGTLRVLGGGSVGIGTSLVSTSALTVMNGNVGIGTWVPGGALTVMNGNIGVGNNNPGAYLNIKGGTAPQVYIEQPGGGSTVSLRIGHTSANAWDISKDNPTNTNDFALVYNGSNVDFVVTSAGNVGIGSSYPGQMLDVQGTLRLLGGGSVGIGTSLVSTSALTVMNGNVGIGTWVPGGSLIVKGGNVGLGSNNPGQVLDVTGSVRATAFIGNGSQLTGITSSQWTTTNTNDVYLPSNGNVGIGTTLTTTSALTVMNGNVGIGTWIPAKTLDVEGSLSTAIFAGNVGIGSANPQHVLEVYGNTSTSNMGAMRIVQAGGASNSSGLEISVNGSSGYPTDIYLNDPTVVSGIAAAKAIEIGANNGLAYFYSLNNDIMMQPHNTTHMYFSTNGMSINNGATGPVTGQGLLVASGNVGIGTVLTANALDVQGGVGIGTAYAGYFSAPSNGLIVQGNVGIGTWIPSQLLDVKGTLRTTNFAMTSGTPVFGYVLTAQDSNGNAAWSTTNSVGAWTVTNTNDVYLPNNGNVGIGTTLTTTSALTVMNGNVGIGTWVPGGSFVVKGGAVGIGRDPVFSGVGGLETSSGIIDYGNLQVVGSNILGGGGGTLNFSNASYYDFIGNVGIGSVTPGQALDVQGTLRILGGGSVGIGTSLVSTSGLTVMNGNVGIGTWVPSGNIELKGDFVANGGGGFGPGIVFNTQGSKSAIIGYFGGVSIIHNTYDSFNILEANVFALGDEVLSASGASGGYTVLEDDNGIGLVLSTHSSNGQNILFAPNRIERARFNSVGNLGIGSTNPGQLLDIQGTVRVLGSGNIGIGTSTPGQKLDVQGTVRATGFTMTTGSPVFGNVLTAAGTSGNAVWASATSVGAWTVTNTNDAYLPNNGNVGIGTTITNAGAALSVMNGNVGIGTWVPAAALDMGATNGIRLGGVTKTAWPSTSQWTTTNTNDVYLPNNGNVGIGTTLTTTSAMSVMNGNVGIGTWVPVKLLDVEGSGGVALNAGKVIVGANYAPIGNFDFSNGASTDFYYSASNHSFYGPTFATAANDWALSDTFTCSGLCVSSGDLVKFSSDGNWYDAKDTGIARNAAGILEVDTGTKGTLAELVASNVGIGTVNGDNYNLTAPAKGSMIVEKTIGIGTYAPTGALEIEGGNVGIGTAFTTTSALSVMNGNVGIGTWVPNSTFVFNGSSAGAIALNVGSVSLDSRYYMVSVDSSAARTITLPDASTIKGRCYKIKDGAGQAATNNVTIQTTSAQTIDGNAPPLLMTVNYQEYDLCSNGSNWLIF